MEETSEPLNMSWPKEGRKRLTYVLVAPILVPLWLTLPDTRTPRGKKFFVITFLGSIFWIAAYSYLMVWWANVFGETADIPPEVKLREHFSFSQKEILIWFSSYFFPFHFLHRLGDGINILSSRNINSGFNHICDCCKKGLWWYGRFEFSRKQYIRCYSRVSRFKFFLILVIEFKSRRVRV